MAAATGSHCALNGHAAGVTCLAVLSERCIASGGGDNTVCVWRRSEPTHSVSDWKCVAVLTGHTAYVRDIAVLPDGCLASCGRDETVRVWRPLASPPELSVWECVAVLEEFHTCTKAVIALSDGCLALCCTDNTVRIWTRSEPALISSAWECVTVRWETYNSYACIAALSGGRFATGGLNTASISVWGRWSRADPHRWPCDAKWTWRGSRAKSIVVLSDESLACLSIDGSVRVWQRCSDPTSPQSAWNCVAAMLEHSGPDCQIAALPGTRLLFYANKDRTMRAWRHAGHADITSGWECVAPVNIDGVRITSLVMLPDELAVCGCVDGTVRVCPHMASLEWVSRRLLIMALVMFSRRGYGNAVLVS